MKSISMTFVLLLSLPFSAQAASVAEISDATELAAALAQAAPGDTLTLDADFQWNGPKPISIPANVTLDGARHTITNINKGVFINQKDAAGVVCRNLGLATQHYAAWTIAVENGDLRFENCNLGTRFIAWKKGAITLDGCKVAIQQPAGSDNNNPVGVYSGGASFTATNCVFKFGWDDLHVGLGFFHNFGGDPASRLSLSKCTIIGATDRHHNAGSRHLSVFQSDNAEGPDYETIVTDCIILAEVKSVFHSTGKGKTVSSHNNNAGMLRNPGIMERGNPAGVSFYQRDPDDAQPEDRTGDIEEPNPFVDAPNGDYRLLVGTLSATGASDGGPMGADGAAVAREMNSYNLDLNDHVLVRHRTKGFVEALFDGWNLRRDTDQLRSFLAEGQDGRAMRLEANRNDEGTGGPGQTITQNAWQSFVTVPGWEYTIRANARRGSVGLMGKWDEHGSKARAILGAADGLAPDPGKLIASATLNGPEGLWQAGEIVVIAPSSRLTIHLIHRTDGSWNYVEWDKVSIIARAPLNVPVAKGLREPVLAYIHYVPPETDEARAARHKKVAERRANNPIIIHRGAHKFDPENTLEAYDRAMALGADGVEFDPHRSKDGVIYTFHDDTVNRMLRGDGEGKDMTYYQLASLKFKNLKGNATEKTRVPTVVSLFQLARERAMLLHFDIKKPGIEDELITLLDEFDMWDHMVFVTPSSDSDRLRHHPKAKLMEYKPDPNYNDPAAVKAVMEGPGNMMWCDADPTYHVKGLGRPVPGDQPLPESVFAWWWPDGKSVPVKSEE